MGAQPIYKNSEKEGLSIRVGDCMILWTTEKTTERYYGAVVARAQTTMIQRACPLLAASVDDTHGLKLVNNNASMLVDRQEHLVSSRYYLSPSKYYDAAPVYDQVLWLFDSCVLKLRYHSRRLRCAGRFHPRNCAGAEGAIEEQRRG